MNIGDKVQINIYSDKRYPFGLSDRMLEFNKQTATITSKIPADLRGFKDFDGYCYKIDLDGGLWSWSNPMFATSINILTL